MVWGRKKDPMGQLATSLIVAEYTGIREEIGRAQERAGAIVNWTSGSFAALFGAGVLAASTALLSSATLSARFVVLFGTIAVFGVALPALLFAGEYAWIGEYRSIARFGAYLRSLERSVAAVPGARAALGVEPLRWERVHRSADDKVREIVGPSTGPFRGTWVFFRVLGATATAAAVFVWWLLYLRDATTWDPGSLLWAVPLVLVWIPPIFARRAMKRHVASLRAGRAALPPRV